MDGNCACSFLNDVYRKLSKQNNFTLFDFDLDLWAKVDFKYDQDSHNTLFRGGLGDNHPRPSFTAEAADKLLRRTYSRFLYVNGSVTENTTNSILPIGMNTIRFMKEADSDHLYYLALKDSQWVKWSHVPSHFLTMNFMGVGDVMLAEKVLLHSIYLKGRMLDVYDNQVKGVLTTSGKKFVIVSNRAFLILQDPNIIFQAFHLNANISIFVGVEDDFVCIFDCAKYYDNTISDIYQNKTLIRFNTDRQVYLVDNFVKRPIPSIQIFYKYGWDFDQVKVSFSFIFIFMFLSISGYLKNPLLLDSPQIGYHGERVYRYTPYWTSRRIISFLLYLYRCHDKSSFQKLY